ncbi:carbohydrate ABC transporter permease [Microbacterium sp. A204]|uniref:carbohydrate ABC transporter permease n=1 Tax=Microbacterium sp. A204 TaxID=3457321 RepID=UPI003FD35D8B
MTVRILRHIGNFVIGAIVVVASLYPTLWLLAISLKSDRAAYELPVQWFFVPDFSTYASLFADRDFVASLINSIQLTAIATLLCLLFGALAAYAMSRYKFRGSGVLTSTLVLTRLVPSFAIVLPTFFIFRSLGLLDSMTGLALALVAFQVPLTVLIMFGIFQGIPIALDEAARLDGAGVARTFFTIILPVARPGLAASAVVTFILIWNEFLFVLVLAGDRLVTMPMLISSFQTDKAILWSEIAAASIISLVPIALLILFAQKHLLSGLGAGAVRE